MTATAQPQRAVLLSGSDVRPPESEQPGEQAEVVHGEPELGGGEALGGQRVAEPFGAHARLHQGESEARGSTGDASREAEQGGDPDA